MKLEWKETGCNLAECFICCPETEKLSSKIPIFMPSDLITKAYVGIYTLIIHLMSTY